MIRHLGNFFSYKFPYNVLRAQLILILSQFDILLARSLCLDIDLVQSLLIICLAKLLLSDSSLIHHLDNNVLSSCLSPNHSYQSRHGLELRPIVRMVKHDVLMKKPLSLQSLGAVLGVNLEPVFSCAPCSLEKPLVNPTIPLSSEHCAVTSGLSPMTTIHPCFSLASVLSFLVCLFLCFSFLSIPL